MMLYILTMVFLVAGIVVFALTDGDWRFEKNLQQRIKKQTELTDKEFAQMIKEISSNKIGFKNEKT